MTEPRSTSNKGNWLFVVLFVIVVVTVAAFRVLPKQARARRAECATRLTAIFTLAQTWGLTNQGRFPTNYESYRSLSSGAGIPGSWVCPSERANPMKRETDWSRFRPEHASYVLVPNTGRPQEVFVRCRIHKLGRLLDGSMQEVE